MLTVRVEPHPVFGRDGRQPHRRPAGHLRRGGAGRHRGRADARRRPGQGAHRPGHAERAGAARQGPRRRRRRPGHGDLLVKVQVVVPQRLSDEARAAVEALRDERRPGHDPRADLFARATAGDERPWASRRAASRRVDEDPGLRHLGRGPARRHARADPAPVRPARPGLPRPHPRRRPALLRRATSRCCARCSGCPRTRASAWPASSASSSSRTRCRRCSARVGELAVELERTRAVLGSGARVFAAGRAGDVVAVRAGQRPSRSTSRSQSLVVWRPGS